MMLLMHVAWGKEAPGPKTHFDRWPENTDILESDNKKNVKLNNEKFIRIKFRTTNFF